MDKMEKFRALGLSDGILKALEKKGFEEPTPIQVSTIPLLIQGSKDIIGQAQTGTGKTAAFGLPILEKMEKHQKFVQAVIVAPTRELAIQVAEEMDSFKTDKKIVIATVYGGQAIDQQLRKLKQGVDIVVGTPGRIIDHLNRKSLDLSQVNYVVLDEADEMLNMGFREDIENILTHVNKERQMLLFSATMPSEILAIAKRYMGEYDLVQVKKQQLTTNLTDQIYFEVSRNDKFEALSRIIDLEEEFYGIIFCRTKVDVDEVTSKLQHRGYDVDALHGDVSQHQRERILKRFKTRKINILCATDVAARGLDINDLTHVINYSLPQDPESYVHRVGRTGRAGKEGTAITFVTPTEYRKLLYIQKVAKTDIRKEEVPDIKDIIDIKRNRIMDDLKDSISSGRYDAYRSMAQELLVDADPEDVLCAILKHHYKEELEAKNYNKINKVQLERQGKTRLFIALGKNDGMNVKKLIAFVQNEVNVPSNIISDIKVLENFSFVTLPFKEAELVLEAFKRKKRGKKSIVEKAVEKNNKK
ncbi:MAG: DEAD/DEAH box helicase [Clostridia bacterium]|nr:DEAD/DEAH box helicase [Clostridia bacterium]